MSFTAEQLRTACPHISVGTLGNLVHAQPTPPMQALRVNGVGSVIVGRMVGAGLIVIANPDDWPTPERKRQLVEGGARGGRRGDPGARHAATKPRRVGDVRPQPRRRRGAVRGVRSRRAIRVQYPVPRGAGVVAQHRREGRAVTFHLWTFYNAEVDRRVLDRLRNAERYSGRASRAWIVDSLASVFSPPPRPSYETTGAIGLPPRQWPHRVPIRQRRRVVPDRGSLVTPRPWWRRWRRG